MSCIEEGKEGWSRRSVLRAAVIVPAMAANPVVALAQGASIPSKVSLKDISYGVRFVKKGDIVSYWVRAVPMKQPNENLTVSVVFSTATIGGRAADLAVDQQSAVYKRDIVLTKGKGYAKRGRFRTSAKKRKLAKGQTLHCQLLFESGATASNVWTFKV